jgi:hypothetical protein
MHCEYGYGRIFQKRILDNFFDRYNLKGDLKNKNISSVRTKKTNKSPVQIEFKELNSNLKNFLSVLFTLTRTSPD